MEPEIRPLRSIEEIAAAVDLQRAVWGAEDRDLVPATEIVAARENGGIVLGAWSGNDLVGFVFSMVGRRDGRVYQYSRMLAVDERWRGKGLGAALKLAQRDAALRAGDRWMEWTFDPLEGRNAALNIRRLGARVHHYHRDFYGARTTRFDLGIPTDRLRAEWELTEDLSRTNEERQRDAERAPFAFTVDTGGSCPVPGSLGSLQSPRSLRVAIPVPFQPIREGSQEIALRWRLAVRSALEAAFTSGLEIVDFDPAGGPAAGLGAYLLKPIAGSDR